jgi:hypothetical protein
VAFVQGFSGEWETTVVKYTSKGYGREEVALALTACGDLEEKVAMMFPGGRFPFFLGPNSCESSPHGPDLYTSEKELGTLAWKAAACRHVGGGAAGILLSIPRAMRSTLSTALTRPSLSFGLR